MDKLGAYCDCHPSAGWLAAGWFGVGEATPALDGRIGDYVLIPKGHYGDQGQSLVTEKSWNLIGVHGGASPEEMWAADHRPVLTMMTRALILQSIARKAVVLGSVALLLGACQGRGAVWRFGAATPPALNRDIVIPPSGSRSICKTGALVDAANVYEPAFARGAHPERCSANHPR
ncbi:MAG: hypothetical protein U1F68_10695 [Gammaproteobacteria bacterium]